MNKLLTEMRRQSLITSSKYSILDELIEGCQLITPDYRYCYVNNSVAAHRRQTRERFIGQTMMDVYPGIEKTQMFSILQKCMEDRLPRRFENKFVFEDGSTGWFSMRFNPVREGVLILSQDITEQKRIEEEQSINLEVLQLIDEAENWESLLKTILNYLKTWSQCEAVGIRIREGADFPYFKTSGFSDEFVRLENHLCSYDKGGLVLRDEDGTPSLDCMCGNIIKGRFDASKTFFTTDGSFWSNCTTDLLATTTEADRQARTRNRCNSVGYESVALIPLRSGKETFGLLQFNDRRKGCFSSERVALFRRIADHIANFIAKKHAEIKVMRLNAILRGIMHANHVITQENDLSLIIQRTCDVLVDSRGFQSVAVGLMNGTGERIRTFSWAGEKLMPLRKAIDRGELPACVRQAVKTCRMVSKREHRLPCRTCAGDDGLFDKHDVLVACLKKEDNVFGFMAAHLWGGFGNNSEEQELLQEVANNISFAIRSFALEDERDKSRDALADVQEQLRQVQKLEAVGRLAGGVAHDFNNILMVQLGYCDMLEGKLDQRDPICNIINDIKKGAKRAANLTRQLLAFSRKQTLVPQVLDLNTVLNNLEKMLGRLIGEDIELSFLLENNLWRVKADSGQIEQVIMNLIVNARDAMPEGGKLIIETDNIMLDDAYVKGHINVAPGPHVLLTISDTGHGMDEKTKSHIFEPFFTTKGKEKGTGLGLSTAYGIVKQSGGDIRAYSEPGIGSTFKIYLPRVEAELAQSVESAPTLVHGKGENIFLVEDEPSLRKLFAEMIMDLGYRVQTATNGVEALKMIEKEDVKPDLLITDVVMPGISGKKLVEHLEQMQPGLKVLYMSGYTDDTIIQHGITNLQVPFLQKPFSTVSLSNKIRNILDV